MKAKYIRWEDPDTCFQLIDALNAGELIAGTTDTVLGLFAAPTRQGFNRLNKVKKRADKPYLMLISSQEKVEQFALVSVHSKVHILMQHCWPGPLTLIVNARDDIPDYMSSSTGAVAVRVPRHKYVQQLLESFPALFSTSANVTNKPVPSGSDELDQQIVDTVAYVVTEESDGSALPSTLLDCTGEQIKVIREGAYSIAFLEELVSETFVR